MPEPTASARAAEERRRDMIRRSVARIVDPQTAADLFVEVEGLEHPVTRENPVLKLERLNGTRAGREWLSQHPDAGWDEIADADV